MLFLASNIYHPNLIMSHQIRTFSKQNIFKKTQSVLSIFAQFSAHSKTYYIEGKNISKWTKKRIKSMWCENSYKDTWWYSFLHWAQTLSCVLIGRVSHNHFNSVFHFVSFHFFHFFVFHVFIFIMKSKYHPLHLNTVTNLVWLHVLWCLVAYFFSWKSKINNDNLFHVICNL